MGILGQNLKRIRTGKFTQFGLEAASTVSRATIADLERGSRSRCDSDTLLRLANALGCTADELLRPPAVSNTQAAPRIPRRARKAQGKAARP